MITFRPHTAWVTALAFSPDGRALASVSHDCSVKVWELNGLASRTLRWKRKSDRQELNHCQYGANGELFTGGLDGCIRVWSPDGKLLREHVPDIDRDPLTLVFAFVLSRDGRYIAWCGHTLGGAPSHIVVADTKALEVVRRIPAHEGDGRILAAYPGGFCSGAADQLVKFWDWESETCHHTSKLRGMSRALAVAPDGTRIAIAGVITITAHQLVGHLPTGEPVHFRGHTKRIECIEYSPDGTKLASASADRTLRIWDAATGKCLRTFALKLGPLHWVSFAPDGLTLAFSSTGGDIGLLDLDG